MKKAIPRFLAVSILMVSLMVSLNVLVKNVKADVSTPSATVTNTGPSFDVAPTDEDEGNGNPSTASNPTNVGSNVKFEATGNDPNAEQYYLAVCEAAGISAGDNDTPTCTGAGAEWCYSTATNDEVEASCTYTVQAGDSSSEAWYAYVCDKHSGGGACSAVSQGSGDSGSPFYVNHEPSFTAVNDAPDPLDPGAQVTITTTASDATDSDNVKLFVCKTASCTSSGCGGGEWCHADLTASDPTCNFNAATPSEGAQHYYPYIYDEHGLAASGGTQGSDNTFTVNNVAPVVSNVKLNNDGDITLTQSHGDTPNYTNINVTGTVTDNNGCGDIVTADTKADIFTDDMAHTACDTDGEDDNNDCYALISCTLDGGSCTGGSDLDSTYTCTVGFLYHADPTVANTPKATNKWTAFLKSKDEALDATPVEAGTKVEMNDLISLDVTATIAYGSLAVGQITDGTNLPQTTTVTNKGNAGLDATLYGVDMTGAGTIAVGKQKYAATAVTYGTATALLVTPGAEHELNCLKNTGSGDPKTKDVYWGLQIPDETPTGGYTGTDTFTGLMSESGEW